MALMTFFTTGGKLAGILRKARPDIPIKEVDYTSAMELWTTKSEVHPDLLSAEILCSEPSLFQPMMSQLTNLRWVHSLWAGNEKLMQDAPLFKSKGFVLTRQGGVYAPAMADYVVGQIVARERFFQAQHQNQLHKQWQTLCNGKDLKYYRLLNELSIGILGLGDIGKTIARSCKGMGMTVWGLVRSSTVPAGVCDHVCTGTSLSEFLSSVDYVCNVLPSTDLTRDLLSGDVLKACQHKKACFINIGRGDVIKESDLVHALTSGWLSGAILDVFEQEPLPEDSILWEQPEVVITPHLSGWARSDQYVIPLAENYDRFVSGEKLHYLVDLDAGY